MSTFKVNIKDKREYKQKDENKICKKLLVLSDESIYNNIKLFSNEIRNVRMNKIIQKSPLIKHIIVENDEIPEINLY